MLSKIEIEKSLKRERYLIEVAKLEVALLLDIKEILEENIIKAELEENPSPEGEKVSWFRRIFKR